MVCFSPKQGSRVAAWQDKAEGFQCEAEESVNNSPRFSSLSPEPYLIRAPKKYHLSKAHYPTPTYKQVTFAQFFSSLKNLVLCLVSKGSS